VVTPPVFLPEESDIVSDFGPDHEEVVLIVELEDERFLAVSFHHFGRENLSLLRRNADPRWNVQLETTNFGEKVTKFAEKKWKFPDLLFPTTFCQQPTPTQKLERRLVESCATKRWRSTGFYTICPRNLNAFRHGLKTKWLTPVLFCE
jgi:hypothetical protein